METEKKTDVEAIVKAPRVRRSTESLLQSEIVNERFAGIVRKMSEVLKRPKAVNTEKFNEKQLLEHEEKLSATDKLYRVKTSAIVSAILKVKEPLLSADVQGQPKNEYVPKLKGIILDLAFENSDGTKGRMTVEMEMFYAELVAKFKVEKTSTPKFVLLADYKLF